MAEGQTATNPQTGERVVLRGGQWVPVGGAASPRPSARQPTPRQSSRYQGPMPTSADEVFGSLIAQESGGRAGVRGPDTQYGNALGRTQVLPSTARGIAKNLGIPYREDLLTGTSPEAASYQDQLGRAYLQEGFQNTGNAREALMYYHGGPDRSLWGPKTNAYADEVLSRWSQGGGVAPVDGPQAQPQQQQIPEGATATNPETGERVTFTGGQWVPAGPIEVEIDTPGIRTIGGKTQIYDPASGSYYDATPEQVNEYQASLRRSQSDRQARVEREADPEYQAAIADARRGAENVPDRLRALGLGGTYGFLTDINAEAQRGIQAVENAGRRIAGQEVRYGSDMAAQAARDAMRDAQAQYAAENPVENFALQFAGGLVAPGMIQAGRYVGAAQGAQATGRAAQVGAATGLASGLGYGEGSLIERAPEAAISTAAGAGIGALGQAGINRLGRAGEGGGAARRLSRAGVNLTPGQMLAEVPVAGPSIRYAEDILSGYNPLMTGVRQRQNEDVVRVAGQEALDNIGVRLPREARTGREVYNATRTNLSKRYDEVTDRVNAVLDDDFDLMMDNLRREADRALDSDHASRFNRILDENVLSEVGPDGRLSGDSFKRIETTLRQQSEKASRPGATLQDDDYAEALNGARDVFRDVIARQFPAEAENIRGLNTGWAINARIRRAVSGSAGFGRDGTPTPGELSQSVRQLSSEEQIAQDRGLLQGLAQDARTVLPATVGDTGSGQRAVLGGAIGALGTGAVATVNPALAGMIVTGAVVYSRPGIALLNAAYRATDSQAANAIVRQLADQARRNPSLIPYHEAAVQHALSLARTDTPAAQQAPMMQPTPSPALQRVMQ